MNDVQEFYFKGYTIRARRLYWSVLKNGHCVAAGGVWGTPQANLTQGKKVVRELLAGKRKPFPKPEPIPEGDRLVVKRMLAALNAGMREALK